MRLPIFILLFIFSLSSMAQSVTGSWYGNANIVLEGRYNSYLTELIIQQKGDEVVGIFGYYFRNGYESVFVRGNYNNKNRTITINDIPITYFREKNIDGVDCYMDFSGQLMVSKVQSNINGHFITNAKYKYTCPELRVLFEKDTTQINKQASLIRLPITRKLWQPLPQDVIVTTKPAKDTATAVAVVETKPQEKPKEIVTADKELQVAFESRKNILSNDIIVQSDSIRVSFYDNGDIDGDSISVFLNKIPVLTKAGLTAKALNIYIQLDNTKEINELSMFAENLGKYPPNTALMVINDGSGPQEIYLSSSLTQNATVRIRRKNKN